MDMYTAFLESSRLALTAHLVEKTSEVWWVKVETSGDGTYHFLAQKSNSDLKIRSQSFRWIGDANPDLKSVAHDIVKALTILRSHITDPREPGNL